ncbi:amidase family protein, partial [Sandarakinorhabdus sp.]|uniref:amidase family protein n=1 Tax=Sandarakinorhabdus sp. TaxID=1916663 RepID=UPI00286E2100
MELRLDRRQLLAAGTAAALPLPALAAVAVPDDTQALAQHIIAGHTSARAVTEAAITRLEAAQAKLNCAVLIDRAAADRLPKVPGAAPVLPTLIKDLNDWQGQPTRNGSRAFADVPPAKADDPFVAALTGLDLNPIGKSATPEFGLMCVTEPLARGPTRNPWNPDLSPGGSSGGSAAAVASGVVTIAHANDGGGSIRIPASLTGLFGFKPSRGRSKGMTPKDDAADIAVDHVLTRSVRDSAFALLRLQQAGAEGLAPLVPAGQTGPLTIGVLTATANGTVPDAEVMAAIAGARALLTRLGHKVVDAEWSFSPSDFARDFTDFWAMAAARSAGEVRSKLGADAAARLEPLTAYLAARGAAIAQADARAIIGRLFSYREAYNASFAGMDVLMTPVLTRHAIP